MNCPNCNGALMLSEKQGIEIDVCPNCRGIWLDRGELDKIIERSSNVGSQNYQQNEHFNKLAVFTFANSYSSSVVLFHNSICELCTNIVKFPSLIFSTK